MTGLTRRQAITGLTAALGLLPSRVSAAIWPIPSGFHRIDQRHLWIRQAGRQEALHVAFRELSGAPRLAGIEALSWLLRDWRDDDTASWIDPRLFDVLAGIQTFLSISGSQAVPLVLNSGYRTPRRNATLEGAAVNSQHILGRAADITVPGHGHAAVRDAADLVGTPGLGRYTTFTHVDVGPPGRRWNG